MSEMPTRCREFLDLVRVVLPRFDALPTQMVRARIEQGRVFSRLTQRDFAGCRLYEFRTVESELMNRVNGILSFNFWLLDTGHVFADAGFGGVAMDPIAYVKRAMNSPVHRDRQAAPLKPWRLDGVVEAVKALERLVEELRVQDLRSR